LLGKAKYYEHRRDYTQCLEVLNSVIVLYSWFLPALTEKAKVLLMLGDWDQAFETAQRVVSQVFIISALVIFKDTYNIEAIKMTLLYHMTRETKPSTVLKRLGDLLKAFELNEPKNAPLLYSTSKTLSRIAGRNIP
jgi:tetratricopeptide repeat protein 21B